MLMDVDFSVKMCSSLKLIMHMLMSLLQYWDHYAFSAHSLLWYLLLLCYVLTYIISFHCFCIVLSI